MKPRRFVASRWFVASRRFVTLAVFALILVSPLVAGLGTAYSAPAAGASFSDVPLTQANSVAIADLSGRGIINGFADGTFKPDDPVTRQQFAKMIVKTLGLTVTGTEVCPFTDVDLTPNATDPNYPAKYVAVCATARITTGKTPTTFDPKASITRQQLLTMVVRATGLPQPPADYKPPFSASQFTLDEHFANASAAAYAGLLGGLGVDRAYSFSAAATRGECAQVLHNLLFRKAQGSSVDLIHFWWDWSPNWQDFRAESISYEVDPTGGSAKMFGDPYYSFYATNFPGNYIFATGVNGDLLVFTYAGVSNWSVEHVPAPGGSRISPLLGGRAFDEVTAVTTGNVATLHVFATDADDNLVHFWLPQTGGTWRSENVSAKTGLKMHLMGSACTWEDASVVQVVGTSASGELLHFWMTGGGTWSAENVSRATAKTIKGKASFNWDANGGLGTAVVAAGPNDELLIFHHKGPGEWSVEDVTAATKTDTQPGVRLGGWLSWWRWEQKWDPTMFKDAVGLLDPDGHFWLLQRAGGATWTTKDISAEIRQTFRADTGGDSIIDFRTPPTVPAAEVHFGAVNLNNDFVHIWRDEAGRWHAEDTATSNGQKVANPVNYYSSVQRSGADVAYLDQVCVLAPNGDMVFVWDDPGIGGWHAFNVSAVVGFRVRAPELPWTDSHEHLVLPGVK